MSTPVKPIPDGYQAVIPYLVVSNAAAVIDFVKAVFGAEEILRMTNPDGKIGHTELRVGGCVIMLSEGGGQYKPMPSMLYVYVTDVDTVYQRAVAAGAVSLKEPEDQFYGDRTAGFADVSGNQWFVGTHIEDMSEEELLRRHKAARSAQSAG
jgi:PhnB protein